MSFFAALFCAFMIMVPVLGLSVFISPDYWPPNIVSEFLSLVHGKKVRLEPAGQNLIFVVGAFFGMGVLMIWLMDREPSSRSSRSYQPRPLRRMDQQPRRHFGA